MQAAILQNSVGVGGRSKVISRVAKTLLNDGWSITLHTFSESNDVCRFLTHYDLHDDRIRSVTYDSPMVPGTIYQQPILNYKSSDKLRSYDLLFNSNNCLRFLPSEPKTIHYIHLPTPSIPKTNARYRTPLRRVFAAPVLFWAKFGYSVDPNDVILANSKYTLEHARSVYDFHSARVVYPPCISTVSFDGFSGDGVVSLGSFHPNKRQLFQLRIAEQFPEMEFTIIGSKSSDTYFNKCERYLQQNRLDNVELLPDASDEEVANALSERRIFLHSMKNEPFGIVTVEALNSGCIPVVHDSGGQREIVPQKDLRFTDQDTCVEAISAIMDGGMTNPVNVEQHLSRFTVEEFDSSIRGVL